MRAQKPGKVVLNLHVLFFLFLLVCIFDFSFVHLIISFLFMFIPSFY